VRRLQHEESEFDMVGLLRKTDYCELCGNAMRINGDCMYCTPLASTHRYLVIAGDTIESQDLRDLLREMAASDSRTEFVILAGSSSSGVTGPLPDVADGLARSGIRVTRLEPRAGSVVDVLESELAAHPGTYDSVILCTKPTAAPATALPRLRELERRFGLPIAQVTG
jgi:hypothetical protein